MVDSPRHVTRTEHTFQCNSRHPIGAEKPTCNCGAAWDRPWHVGGWGEIWTDDGTKVSNSDAGALREILVELHNRMLEAGK